MTTTLTTKGTLLLEDLPRYYVNSRSALAVLDATSRELQRIEDLLTGFQTQFFPQNATDQYNLLGLWEWILGLPVKPGVATLLERQSAVVAAWRKRNSGSGANWVDNVNTALGSTAWSHSENTPGAYQLTITLPGGSTYNIDVTENFLETITPAHLQVIVTTGGGFVVDSSTVDQGTV